MTSKEIRETISGIQKRRKEILQMEHPSQRRHEYIRLLHAEVDLETELERRRNAAEIAAFHRIYKGGGEK